MKRELIEILVEDVDEEILDKMPEWFRILKEAYNKNFRIHGIYDKP